MNKASLLAGLAVVAVSAAAQTYQWKDGSGRTVISDTPPPASSGAREIGGKRPAYASEKLTEESENAARDLAEREQEFRKRRQEAREKAEQDARDKAASKEREDNCERARKNLATLESAAPVSTYDKSGERRLMDKSQRDQEIARLRRIVAEQCR